MKNLKKNIIFLLLPLALNACKKVIDLDLGNKTGQLVIDGNLTNIKGTQSVKLSTNVPFTNTNIYPAVTGAIVTINDDQGESFSLKELAPGNYSIDNTAGIPGRKYSMNVNTGGKDYSATSIMPFLVKLDSVTTKISDFDSKKRQVIVNYQDPPGVPNQYRFVMYVNDVQVKAVFAFNDDFNDGKYVRADIREDDIDVYPGDKVTIEMQNIDKPIYTYWLTLMQQSDNGPGGGVAPSNPPTNISPATLGYFSAHTTQTMSIVVK